MINVFVVGDVVGRSGRKILAHFLPKIRDIYAPDIFLINGENAAGGYGLTKALYDDFIGGMRIDAITMGNHWHDNKEIFEFADHAERLVLPANMTNVRDETMGLKILQSQTSGVKFAILNVIGRAFMHDNNRNPYEAAARLMQKIPADVKIRICDMHAEATSEKQAMGYFLAGKFSLVYGTHSHVPTADMRILSGGTGFLTDLGATGAYDSIIGMDKDNALKRLLTGAKIRLEPAEADPWLCALYAEIDEMTGQCRRTERVIWKLNDIEQNSDA